MIFIDQRLIGRVEKRLTLDAALGGDRVHKLAQGLLVHAVHLREYLIADLLDRVERGTGKVGLGAILPERKAEILGSALGDPVPRAGGAGLKAIELLRSYVRKRGDHRISVAVVRLE